MNVSKLMNINLPGHMREAQVSGGSNKKIYSQKKLVLFRLLINNLLAVELITITQQ